MLCPCGSKQQYEHCCRLIIDQEKWAKSPEQLMRSRYSAYATYSNDNNKSAQYIYDTYAKNSQKSQSVDEIADWASQCHWVKLTIHSSSPFKSLSTNEQPLMEKTTVYPTVNFSAFYLIGNKLNKITESSRFIREKTSEKQDIATENKLDKQIFAQHQWRYLDGDVTEHTEISTIKRNDSCPCNSNKKFKQCCGR